MSTVDPAASPGPWTLHVIPYHKDDPAQSLQIDPRYGDKTVSNPGWSLSRFLKNLGGEEGYITDPEGKRHYFSLKPWIGLDPETTRFRVQFIGPTRRDPAAAAEIRKQLGL